MKNKSRFTILQKIILIMFGVVIIISVYMIYYEDARVKNEAKAFESLKIEIESTKDEKDNINIEKLKEVNEDIVGWIKVNGTNIDYPVMQKKDDSEYYLYRDFNKNESISGTPFLGEGMSLDQRGTNVIIYGHNMKNKTMFNNILMYKDKSFWESNNSIEFYTINGKEEYKIFTVVETSIEEEEKGSPYYSFKEAKNNKEFNEFIIKVKDKALYNTGITPNFGDELLTLSTCSYNDEEGRFYIVGVKVK